MKKTLLSLLTILSFISTPLAHAEEEGEEIYYYDEDEELFNKGTFVGEETNFYIKQQKKAQYRNWGIAIGTTVASAVAFVLVGLHPSK